MVKASRTPAQLAEALRRRLAKSEANIEQWLHKIGQESVTWARENGSYDDQTANLRNSTGYAIYKDGQLRDWVLDDRGHPEASTQAIRGRSSFEGAIPNEGWALVIYAGMNYGIAVEARGRIVLSGALDSSPHNQLLVEALQNATR